MHTQGKLSGLAPDVTAVIAAYNVEKLLPNAVRSLTSQTLRSIEIIIVDDCSTDGTRDVSQALMADDERIRYVRLERNSGGVGGPRNRGIEEATAPYIVFLDADDVLERHALKNMFLAAEREQAEVVSGRIERINMATGSVSGWYSHLYAEEKILNSIEEFPELIHDTAATNKLYSTRFLYENGLNFEVGLNYEDVLFTAYLYSSMRRMVVLPEFVYEWRGYPSEVRKTISNRRYEYSNIRDRVSVVQRVKEIYKSLGGQVHQEFVRKLLRHHARLYLNDTLAMSDLEATAMLEEFRPLLASLKNDDFDFLFPYERLMFSAAIAGDVDCIRKAVLAERDSLTTGIFDAEPGGRLRWRRSLQFNPQGSALSDELTESLRVLSDDRLVKRSHQHLKYYHQATLVAVRGSEVTIEGYTEDPFGDLEGKLVSGAISLRTTGGKEIAQEPLKWTYDKRRIFWSGGISAPRRNSLREKSRRLIQISLTVKTGGTSVSTVILPVNGVVPIVDRSLIGRTLGDHWCCAGEAYPAAEFGIRHGPRGRALLGFARGGARPLAKFALRRAQRLRSFVGRLRKFSGPTGAIGLRLYRVFRLLPLRQDVALFESHMGRSRADNPGAVYRELTARRPDLECIWVDEAAVGRDGRIKRGRVQRDSWGYLYLLARSRFIVDNQSMPEFFEKREGQTYLQTWHGIPLKKMGLDLRENAFDPGRSRVLKASSQWDGLIVPNPYFERTFVRAFGYEGKLIKYGSPRCDALVNSEHDAAEVKQRLGIPLDSRVVLYAPTFRSRTRAAPLNIDLLEWGKALPTDVVLVLRSHYLNRFHVPPRGAGICVDCSEVDDVTELYAISDVLITDYSSVMFDFAVTGRPIIIFAPDWDHYVSQTRGAYFDLKRQGPGRVVESQEDFFEAVERSLRIGALPEQEAFRNAFAGLEDGNASVRAVDFLLGDGS